MNDTHPDIAKEMDKRFSSLSGSEKVVMACSMYDFAKELVTQSILNAYPRTSQKEVRRQVFLRFYEGDFSPEQMAVLLECLT